MRQCLLTDGFCLISVRYILGCVRVFSDLITNSHSWQCYFIFVVSKTKHDARKYVLDTVLSVFYILTPLIFSGGGSVTILILKRKKKGTEKYLT